jgi:hypothetical protein
MVWGTGMGMMPSDALPPEDRCPAFPPTARSCCTQRSTALAWSNLLSETTKHRNKLTWHIFTLASHDHTGLDSKEAITTTPSSRSEVRYRIFEQRQCSGPECSVLGAPQSHSIPLSFPEPRHP